MKMLTRIWILLALSLSGCATQRIRHGNETPTLAALAVRITNQTHSYAQLAIVGGEETSLADGQSVTVESSSSEELTLVISGVQGTTVRKYCPSYYGQREAWVITLAEMTSHNQQQVGLCRRSWGWGQRYSPQVSVEIGPSRGWRPWQ